MLTESNCQDRRCPPPPQISDLISSVFLSFSKEINGVRHPSVDTSEPQRRRHSSSNNKTFTLDNTSFTEKVFPYSAKKKRRRKRQTNQNHASNLGDVLSYVFVIALFLGALTTGWEKLSLWWSDDLHREHKPQEEWLRIYSSSSLKHFNQQLMI